MEKLTEKTIYLMVIITLVFLYILFLGSIVIPQVKRNRLLEPLKKDPNRLPVPTPNLPEPTKTSEQTMMQVPLTEKISSPYQTEFFLDSMQFAEQVIYNKTVNQNEETFQKDIQKNVDLVTKLTDAQKQSLVIAMRYNTIEPIASKVFEQKVRDVAENNAIPLWFVILYDAETKVFPKDINSDFWNTLQQPVIIPIEKSQVKVIPISNYGT